MRYFSVLLFVVCLSPLSAFAGADAPSFAKDVAPIFARYCIGCHAPGVKMGGLVLASFDTLQEGGTHGQVIVPGKSDESRLYLMVAAKIQPSMPLTKESLSAAQIETIKKWIDAGAKGPAAGEMSGVRPAAPAIPDVKPLHPIGPQIYSLAWRPDGKILALGGHKEVRLRDILTGKIVGTLTGHAEDVRALAFSKDGRLLAAAGGLPARRGEVKIWDVDKRSLVGSIEGHDDCIYAVAFSPDGKWLATSSYDKLIKLWDVETGKEVRTLKDHIEAVYALAFTPDGKRLVSGAADRSVKVWDTATPERLYTMSEPTDGLNTMALDPSGRRVAAGGLDKTIRIWELGEKGGTLINSLIAHEDAILKLAWSPDGTMLASSSADKTIKIFRTADLTEIKSLGNQPDWVFSVEFSPDGKELAAGRYDGSLSIYEVPDFRDTLETRRASR